MPAPDSVLKLYETFAAHRDHYRSANYNEAQLRREFVDPAYQLRRYAWSAKMPLSILSDFEEFAIYDTDLQIDHLVYDLYGLTEEEIKLVEGA